MKTQMVKIHSEQDTLPTLLRVNAYKYLMVIGAHWQSRFCQFAPWQLWRQMYLATTVVNMV